METCVIYATLNRHVYRYMRHPFHPYLFSQVCCYLQRMTYACCTMLKALYKLHNSRILQGAHGRQTPHYI